LSGCYDCRFENIDIGSSRRLVMVEGARNTVFDGVTGEFRERGIEFAMYATDNLIRNVDARLAGNHIGIRPAIRFGEHARRNRLENVRLDLDKAYRGRRDKVRLDDAADNTLFNIELLVEKLDGWPLVYSSRPGQSFTALNVRICDGSMCKYANTASLDDGSALTAHKDEEVGGQHARRESEVGVQQ
jgi:hypothetical protein